MDYFMEFQWWYILAGILIFSVLFGKKRGGLIVKRFTAALEVLDERFKDSPIEAKYNIFKKGPDHIEIEVKELSIPVDDELEIHLNGVLLAKVKVKKNRKAKFDHWSDGDVKFPAIKDGDKLVIQYQNVDVLKGTFRSANG